MLIRLHHPAALRAEYMNGKGVALFAQLFSFVPLSLSVRRFSYPATTGSIKLSASAKNSPDWSGHEIVSGETGGRAPFFSRLGYGGNRSSRLVGGMRRGQDSPVDKSLKKPAREPRNERKDFMACACFNADYLMLSVLCALNKLFAELECFIIITIHTPVFNISCVQVPHCFCV